jgi:hypothetical protein
MQKFDHNIGFREKRQFFHRKLAKIAENCDHNIDPRMTQQDDKLKNPARKKCALQFSVKRWVYKKPIPKPSFAKK